MTNSDLIRRWQLGERSAFDDLMVQWQPAIQRFLMRMVGCAQTAEDLSQEVFLKAFQATDTYRDRTRFSSWLYKIAANVACDCTRARIKRPQAIDTTKIQIETSPSCDLEQNELVAGVRAGLASLGEEQRLALILRHYEQLSFEEIARITETPASTVKSRFSSALRQLESELRRRGIAQEDTKE